MLRCLSCVPFFIMCLRAQIRATSGKMADDPNFLPHAHDANSQERTTQTLTNNGKTTPTEDATWAQQVRFPLPLRFHSESAPHVCHAIYSKQALCVTHLSHHRQQTDTLRYTVVTLVTELSDLMDAIMMLMLHSSARYSSVCSVVFQR